ncbi:Predicted dithiol-disulfide isomerase, DsbA family [Granulicatella balaenopterae]|uniref:Predicted dithiol-disulfide isomerase, DsbA family n=1 Tax=Granulicatella balaenopterae TaxID=137733 RepID=A0A1H9MMC3_9LACT|nr:DsbA family protein [Granulicatella balaenopterae]SER24850.1 Predicted dithiol-disulfide isomerase, DsbA family [Granulicatella balaenopterae]
MCDILQFPQENCLSSDRIFDLYLFVNPISENCYRCEKEVLEFIDQIPNKVHYHFITFHNFKTVTHFMKKYHLDYKNCELRNEIYRSIYDASLSYKAACLQGKRLGNQFLITLQRYLHVEKVPYSQELIDSLIDEIGLDREMFLEDKESDLVRLDYEKDQKIALEMNIQHNPSLVVFDTSNQHFGMLIDNCISATKLHTVCMEQSEIEETCCSSKQTPCTNANNCCSAIPMTVNHPMN